MSRIAVTYFARLYWSDGETDIFTQLVNYVYTRHWTWRTVIGYAKTHKQTNARKNKQIRRDEQEQNRFLKSLA